MPVATSPRGTRAVSVVPAQGLFLLNSPLVRANAEALAASLGADARLTTDTTRLEQLYLRLFSRRPAPDESERSLRLVRAVARQQQEAGESNASAGHTAWARLVQTLLMANEFLVIE
jgi:hypothetical protein